MTHRKHSKRQRSMESWYKVLKSYEDKMITVLALETDVEVLRHICKVLKNRLTNPFWTEFRY